MKDYSKHWLIQEAEQRRISEAKQKQNLSSQQQQHHGQIEKIENINNNNNGGGNYPEFQKRAHNDVSDNIFANVDPTNFSYNSNHNSR